MIWKNDVIHGYKNNARCSHGEYILPNTAVEISAIIYGIEKNVDVLKYDINGENATLIDETRYFTIEGDTNNLETFVWFEFISDGSLQLTGFEMSYKHLSKSFKFGKLKN
uniref:Uncharacterized protein n=1 Tax=Panagrolaimus sp. ES5 TaxID=591445 RepID=A0AC34FTY1_9BILA